MSRSVVQGNPLNGSAVLYTQIGLVGRFHNLYYVKLKNANGTGDWEKKSTYKMSGLNLYVVNH